MEGRYTKNGQQTAQKKLNNKPEGRRNIGTPQTRWGDDFREEGTGPIYDDDDNDKKYEDISMFTLFYMISSYSRRLKTSTSHWLSDY